MLVLNVVFVLLASNQLMAAIGTCVGTQCDNLAYCRSEFGYCGGTAYCNSKSTWDSSCGFVSSAPTTSTLTCSAAACTVANHCRSQYGFCGTGTAYCNEFSTWTSSCSSTSTRAPTVTVTKSPSTAVTTKSPTSKTPTASNTKSPTGTGAPTKSTTKSPTVNTKRPTKLPTVQTTKPTKFPTQRPTAKVTSTPTKKVTSNPTTSSTNTPTTKGPTLATTLPPTLSFTNTPTTKIPTTLRPTNPPTSKSPTTLAPVVTSTKSPTSTSTLRPTTKTPTTPPVANGNFHVGSYFAEWGIYARAFYVKNLQTSGQAAKLTFLNYAFANIYKMSDGTYKCDASITRAESGNGDGGDQYAAYGKGFDASTSVDGVGDVWDFPYNDPRTTAVPRTVYPLKGNFNQLKKLKARNPNLKILISLGGWSWSKWFSAAAATDALRKTLVTSCIDQYIKGNLPIDIGSNAGGVGSGYGVFDGIDLDWEYPGVQGIGYNTVSAGDQANQILLYQEFRKQLDAYGATLGGRQFYLTVAIGAGLEKIQATDPASYSQYLDWINIMSYDFQGAWNPSGPTDFQSNLYSDSSSPNYPSYPDFNIHSAVQTLLSKGVPAKKLNVGIPFYGRGWTGVKPGSNAQYPGLYQSATGPAIGTYENGIEDYKVLKTRPGTVYEHPITKQAYKYDGSNFWSYDTPLNIQTKAQYVKTYQLGGLFSWEADGDTTDGELVTAMANIQN